VLLLCFLDVPYTYFRYIKVSNIFSGANPQIRHEDTGDVALHMAAAAGQLDCIKALLAVNVPCGVRNFENKTPYELARDGGHSICAEVLDKYR